MRPAPRSARASRNAASQPAGTPQARSRFSCVSTRAVRPQAMQERASSRVSGKWARTCSRSCRAATTVRPSRCQRATIARRSAVVRASTAANGSSSRITGQSWTRMRATITRWNWPCDRAPIGRRQSASRPTSASARSAARRAAPAQRTEGAGPRPVAEHDHVADRRPGSSGRSPRAEGGRRSTPAGGRPDRPARTRASGARRWSAAAWSCRHRWRRRWRSASPVPWCRKGPRSRDGLHSRPGDPRAWIGARHRALAEQDPPPSRSRARGRRGTAPSQRDPLARAHRQRGATALPRMVGGHLLPRKRYAITSPSKLCTKRPQAGLSRAHPLRRGCWRRRGGRAGDGSSASPR